jgi:hypothetical protein
MELRGRFLPHFIRLGKMRAILGKAINMPVLTMMAKRKGKILFLN